MDLVLEDCWDESLALSSRPGTSLVYILVNIALSYDISSPSRLSSDLHRRRRLTLTPLYERKIPSRDYSRDYLAFVQRAFLDTRNPLVYCRNCVQVGHRRTLVRELLASGVAFGPHRRSFFRGNVAPWCLSVGLGPHQLARVRRSEIRNEQV